MKSIITSAILIAFFQLNLLAQEESNRVTEKSFAFKFTPTQMIVGELNLGVEFKVGKKTSIEVEFGPTISELGFGGKGPGKDWDDEPIDPSIPEVESESSIGYFGAIGFRFYPLEKSQAMNKLYLMPQFKYRVYNSILSESTGLWDEVDDQKIQYKFHFDVGYQLWASRNFGFDFFLGGGMGYNSGVEYNPISVINTSGISYEWEEDVWNEPRFLLVGGIKIAVGN